MLLLLLLLLKTFKSCSFFLKKSFNIFIFYFYFLDLQHLMRDPSQFTHDSRYATRGNYLKCQLWLRRNYFTTFIFILNSLSEWQKIRTLINIKQFKILYYFSRLRAYMSNHVMSSIMKSVLPKKCGSPFM